MGQNNTPPDTKRRPTHVIVQVEPRENAPPYWREIGFATEGSDGTISLDLRVLPHNPTYPVQLRRTGKLTTD